MYYVYILTNKTNKVLYTGVTNNIIKRVYEHRMHVIDGFTKKYNVSKLVYVQEFSDVKDAIVAEKKIKGWLRQKKINLIESENPRWHNLYEEYCRDPSLCSG